MLHKFLVSVHQCFAPPRHTVCQLDLVRSTLESLGPLMRLCSALLVLTLFHSRLHFSVPIHQSLILSFLISMLMALSMLRCSLVPWNPTTVYSLSFPPHNLIFEVSCPSPSSEMLVDLPFDIIHHIARRLDIRSHYNLQATCWVLHGHLQDQNTARQCLERSTPHSTWARLALSQSGESGFKHLLGRIYRQKHSIQNASPYSASMIGHGTSFVYADGVCCYSTHAGIRILDFNHAKATEKVLSKIFFSSHPMLEDTNGKTLDPEVLKSIRVCSYSDKILVSLCNFGPLGYFLFAINVDEGFEPSVRTLTGARHDRVLLCVRVRSNNKLFVRHDSLHLVYGTHSARGMHEHHEWLLEVYNLSTGKAVSKEPLQLESFYGSDIGSTACFTIFEGHFYAVTNQTSLESEEVDWTSYYHFISFPLNEPCPDLRIRVIWRRQHVEGPINDAWTLLEFQHDHRTGESLIIECRKEWKNGGSRSFRTCYTQPFHRAQHQELSDGLRHPPDDPLSNTLDKENNSRYETARPRVEKYVHSEEGATGCVKDYIRAKTKWNGYCFNSQSFVDIVTEEYMVDGEWRPRERVKLRVVSREEISPLVVDTVRPRRAGGLIVRPRKRDREGEEMLDGEDEFSTSHVSLWPEDDAPQSLQEILCPGGRVSEVQAMLGDEGLIYMAGPPGAYGERALVFVSFDPTFGFEGMTKLDGTLVRKKERGRQMGSISSLTKKRKSHSDNNVEEGTRGLEPSQDQLQTENKDTASSSLPERTKRAKTDDQATNESLSRPADIDPNVSSTSMATLAPTPSGWPPSAPSPQTVESPSSSSGQDESSTKPSSFSSSSSASSVAPPQQHCANSSSTPSSSTPAATNPTSTAGLLTWRERARYLSIANGVWTR